MEHELSWLFSRQRFGVGLGLERTKALLESLGNPQQRYKSILVGGTNGKGSTAASLESILRSAGHTTGLFTSPHLSFFSERFMVCGKPVSGELVHEIILRIRPHATRLEATFFEIVTAMGCLIFAELGVQIAVFEVGMGGRLDSTNVLSPCLSIITNISLDHTSVLGSTKQAIASEKAGILRSGLPAVSAVEPELAPILRQHAPDLWLYGEAFTASAAPLGWSGWQVCLQTPLGEISFKTPLLGKHGVQNAALAAAAALRLGIETAAIKRGIETTHWAGRMEVLCHKGTKIILDGAHNPAGAKALTGAVRELGIQDLPIIFGASQDKDISEITQELLAVCSRVILTSAQLSPRAAPPASLTQLFSSKHITIASTLKEALAALEGEQMALVCGSLYLIGEIRPLILCEASEQLERWQ